MSINRIDSWTGLSRPNFDWHTSKEIQNTFSLALEAAEGWKSLGDLKRGEFLNSVAQFLMANQEDLASLIVNSMGKLFSEALVEIEKCAWICEWYQENANEWIDQVSCQTDASESMVRYEPLGLILGILPWNFPFWQAFRFMIPNLLAGNTVLLKHDPLVPECAKAIVDIFANVGVAKGVVSFLHVPNESVEALILNPQIKGVAFTGSKNTGRQVATLAASALKPHLLELGGNDAFIVLNDCDIDSTVNGALKSRYTNAGQVCIAAKRFIVEASIYDDFLEDFISESRLFLPSDPHDKMSSMSPLARIDLAQKLAEQCEKLIELGFERVFGEPWEISKACRFSPQIFVAPSNYLETYSISLWDEELFGPVSIIYKVLDEDQAIEVANQSEYGLSASIWTRNVDKALIMSAKIKSGSVFINGISKSDPRLPIGGVNSSGYGRELGADGIKQFLNCKSLWIK